MKSKINKQTLLGKGYNEGFIWLDRYSKTNETDDMGRWARIGYYNGFMISWVTGFILTDGKIEDKKKLEFAICF